jgi:hypothetical protein
MQSDCYELRLGWSIGIVPAQTTFHVAVDETAVANPYFRAKAVELAWLDHFALAWFFSAPSNVTYRSVRCGRVNNGGGPWFRESRLVPGFPGNPSTTWAAECTGVTLASFNGGAWITTRLRYPGVSLGAITNNRLSNIMSNRMATIGQLMLDSWNFAGVTYECVCWSRRSQLWSHFASFKPINFVQALKSRRPGLLRKRT